MAKKEHFANECLESKKVNVQMTPKCVINVLSIILLIESTTLWIVDLGATYHITNSRDCYVDFRQVARGSKRVHVGNNDRI